MEDWQEWQIRADQIAQTLGTEIDELDSSYLAAETQDFNYRAFWPRFRDLKERVRTAPAIRLEAKMDLERRLRGIGSRAYKAQEAVYNRSAERKTELIERISQLRSIAEQERNPRNLRAGRRDFDTLRVEFDAGPGLVPADRQAVWDAWREANQFAWGQLVGIWNENEAELRELLAGARGQIERGNASGARQAIGRFFEALKTREAKQDAMTQMKAEVETLRREVEALELRESEKRSPAFQIPSVSAAQSWRTDLARNLETVRRLTEEAAVLEQRMAESDSILDQAMLRGPLVDKRRKLTELERTNRTLEQRIEQTEESPLISTG